ncbi:MAG: ribosome-associated protein [Flavobacteriales bacterium]|jgi:ribosome-associated protein
MDFEITNEYIELIKLLKIKSLVSSGGEAKMVVDEGLVTVNGETEWRKRAKLRPGDVVVFNGNTITITQLAT